MTTRSTDTGRARWRRRAFAELEADPRFDRFRRRRGRRTLLLVHLAWGALGYGGFGVMTEAVVSGAVIVASGLVWLAGFVVLTGWLNGSVGGVTELPYDVLDEAQRSARRHAEADAHRIVRGVLFLVGLVAVGSLGARFASLSAASGAAAGDAARTVTLTFAGGSWTWTLIAVAAVCSVLAILPLYLLAWRLPDDVADPEDDPEDVERAA
jgi:hypothetical protein